MKPNFERLKRELPNIEKQINQKGARALQYCLDHNLFETEEVLRERVYKFLKLAHYLAEDFENYLLFEVTFFEKDLQ
jgi:hypothetical protein